MDTRVATSNLKTIVRGAYDVQKLRIQMGNRIVGNFKAKMGQEPGMAEEELDADARLILSDLRARYRKITDGVKTFPRQASFKGDEVISTYTELCLLSQYVALEEQEENHFGRLEMILRDYPIYNHFLKPTKGIGPAMAGIIVSEIDISRARYPSSLWALAGLDTAVWFECKEKLHDSAPDRVEKRHPDGFETFGPDVIGEDHDWFALKKDGVTLGFYGLPKSDTKGLWQGRSKRAEHLVQQEYVSRDGEVKSKVGITFNPFLKTKLVGVLAPSFLRAGDNTYSKVYRSYRSRLDSDLRHADKSKGHKHNMALRYMIKRFLSDLYREWRALEGFSIEPDYYARKMSKAA